MTPSNCKWTPELFDICVADPAHVSSGHLYRPAHWQTQHGLVSYHGPAEAITGLNTLPAPQRPPPDVPSIVHCFRTTQESTEACIESTPLVDISSPKPVSSETTSIEEKASKRDKSVCQTSSTFDFINAHNRSVPLGAELSCAGI